MAKISCPKCGALVKRAGTSKKRKLGKILFPVMIARDALASDGGRQPTKCPKCRHVWQV